MKFLLNLCADQRILWVSSDPSCKNEKKKKGCALADRRKGCALADRRSVWSEGAAGWSRIAIFRTEVTEDNFAKSASRSGELRTQKLKSHLVRTRSLNALSLRPGVGQYIAIHATLTARDFFLAYFYPSGPFTCIFSKTSPDFFPCWLWLHRFLCRPAE